MIVDGAWTPTSSACFFFTLSQVGCGVLPNSFAGKVLNQFRESRVAVVSLRVLAVLPSSSLSARTPFLQSNRLSWTGRSPRWSFHRLPLPRRGRSWVTWWQANHRDRRAARKFGVQASPTHCHQTAALPRKFSEVSGQLRQGRLKRLAQPVISGPVVPSPAVSEVKGPTVASSARKSFCSCAKLSLEKRFMRRMAMRTLREKSGFPVRPRKELPVLNIWRRSRKAINRELHALNGNTSNPVAEERSASSAGGERRCF